ncbi:MAG: diiron oxygenase [Acidimicrobiales bacterium]
MSEALIDIEVDRRTADRLNAVSARRRYFPFADEIIDWSVPLSDDWSYMPDGHSVLSGSGLLERLAPAERSFVERWEMTQLMRNIAHGEHLLNQGILAILWVTDPMDPSYRYLLHEVAEECQHMAMFNEWVRRNDDIVAADMGEALWGKAAGDGTEDLAMRLPAAFWVNVLLFEFVGDDFNHALKADPDGRLHPILVQIGKVHTAEETRHIAYAKAWLESGMAKLDDAQRTEVQTWTRLGAQNLIDRGAFLPVRFSDQLEPYLTRDEFLAARATSPAGPRMLRQLKALLGDFEALGAVDGATMRRWEDAGVFG